MFLKKLISNYLLFLFALSLSNAWHISLTANNDIPGDGKTLESFGAFSITRQAFDYIRSVIPEGSTILEFGSGWASGQLSRFYTVYSVEHQELWLNKFDTHYIHAPLKNGWYDASIVAQHMPAHYDLILIDGPGPRGRNGILKYLHLFDFTSTIIMLDDVERPREYKLLQDLSKKLNRPYQIFTEKHEKKHFAVILP